MLIVTTSAITSNAQTAWNYTYDSTGNRTQRVISTVSPARRNVSSNKSLSEHGRFNAFLDVENNKLRIVALGSSGANVSIFDLAGREQISIASAEEVIVVDISGLCRGTYILSVEIDKEKKTYKFSK